MGGVRSICRPGPAWRSAEGRCRSCSQGCRRRAPVAGASRTGWWSSSACPWRGGAAVPGGAQASMLEEVRITGLGVIDDAVLELSAGFTALTGETGAGKTMVVTALGLLFGGRGDPARGGPGGAGAPGGGAGGVFRGSGRPGAGAAGRGAGLGGGAAAGLLEGGA